MTVFDFVMEHFDLAVLVLTVLYPGWNSIALLITSFLKPRVKNVPEQQTEEFEDDGVAVIAAEEQEG